MFRLVLLSILFSLAQSATPPSEVTNLIGTWRTTSDCQTLCLISTPKSPDPEKDGNDIFTLIQFGLLRETIIFRLASPDPIIHFGEDGKQQSLWVLEYKQTVINKKDGSLQHEEMGSFTFEITDRGTGKIYRIGLIPHGTGVISEGTLFNQVPLTDLSHLADAVNRDCGPTSDPQSFQGYLDLFNVNFTECPNIPLRFPATSINKENFNRIFIDTTVYDFETKKRAVNIPFLDANFKQTELHSIFWLNRFMSEGRIKFQLQYVEVLSFIFGKVKDPVSGNVSGVIDWPHMIVSTMDKVENPPDCDEFSFASNIRLTPTD